MCYLQDFRLAIYKKISRWIKDLLPDVFVGFCMEKQPRVAYRLWLFVPTNAVVKELLGRRIQQQNLRWHARTFGAAPPWAVDGLDIRPGRLYN
jgi:hypothetical protein